jgi:hypothetical protein
MEKKVYICNAFSLQMIDQFPARVLIEEVAEFPKGLESAIGHADTAHVFGYEPNRINVKIEPGEILYVAQLRKGRLPEGATTLPPDCEFKFLKVTREM